MKKLTTLTVIATLAVSTLCAKTKREVINLYDGKAPFQKETLVEKRLDGPQLNGKDVVRITDVDTPTITIYKARRAKNDNKTVIVCPGGAYNILAYDMEGSEVCEYLNSIGVNAVLLKYRVPRRKNGDKHDAALEDVQRAISIVRGRADEFGFNPNMIGVMGFSAGGHLSVMASTAYKSRVTPPIDDFDLVNIRPDFAILIYPAYLSGEKPFTLANEVKPSKDTPPTFIAQAENDKTFINSSMFYAYHLKELGVPLTYHVYSEGGHGHGIRDRKMAVDRWPLDLKNWIDDLK